MTAAPPDPAVSALSAPAVADVPAPLVGWAGLAELSPAYFGMVMATGIVSLAANLLDAPTVAQTLFKLNIAFYAVLWVLFALRMLRHPRRFFGDMVDHLRGPGYFTVVAATGILGSQFVLLQADYATATGLWVVALLLWVGLTYTVFTLSLIHI